MKPGRSFGRKQHTETETQHWQPVTHTHPAVSVSARSLLVVLSEAVQRFSDGLGLNGSLAPRYTQNSVTTNFRRFGSNFAPTARRNYVQHLLASCLVVTCPAKAHVHGGHHGQP